VTGQRLKLHATGMEGKETSTYTQSGQSLTRTSRGRQTTGLCDKGETVWSYRLRGNYANKTICHEFMSVAND